VVGSPVVNFSSLCLRRPVEGISFNCVRSIEVRVILFLKWTKGKLAVSTSYLVGVVRKFLVATPKRKNNEKEENKKRSFPFLFFLGKEMNPNHRTPRVIIITNIVIPDVVLEAYRLCANS